MTDPDETKKRAARRILDKHTAAVTSVIKANPNNFFTQLLDHFLVSRDAFDPGNIALGKDQQATILYSQCGTSVGIASSNFSKVVDILSGYPPLDPVVDAMKREGEEAGLMSSAAATSASQEERASDRNTGISRGTTGSSKLDSEPDDKDLRKLVATNVVDSDTLGIMLELKMEKVEMIKSTVNDPASVNMKILAHWKQKETRKPITWHTLIEALEDMDLNRLARQVKEKVEGA